MNEAVLTEYIRTLVDQRTNLEVTLIQVKQELEKLKKELASKDPVVSQED